MSLSIIQPSDFQVTPFVRFKPSLEHGMRVSQMNRIRRSTSDEYSSSSPINLRDASSLFHNFYGVGITGSFSHSVSDDQLGGSGEFQESLDYQSLVKPESRYNGSSGGFHNMNMLGLPRFLSAFAVLYNVTNDMVRLYSQEPPDFDDTGFIGFGIKLAEIKMTGVTSPRSGGSFDRIVTLASYPVKKENVFIGTQVVGGERVSFWDGSLQAYWATRDWGHPDLFPEAEGTFETSTFRLRDNSGNNIPLVKTVVEYKTTAKAPIWKYNKQKQKSEIVGATRTPPPNGNCDFVGSGKFFDYSGDVSHLQPNNYPI